MHLADALLRELETPGLSLNEHTRLRCRLAKQLEQAGDFEAAREAMADLWQGVGARPPLEGLDNETKAEVLLRIGALTGWIAHAARIEGSQEMAKDLISESACSFENLGKRNKVGEARSELALCYWRTGAFDEARVILQEALDEFDESDIEQRAIALLRKAIVERSSTRLSDALSIYNEATPLFDFIDDHLLTGHFHHGFANVLNQLGTAEHRQDYVDRALIEYSAASFHFEQAGHIRVQACVDINIGFLFFTLQKFPEAHEHLDRAQLLLTKLKDNPHLAQVDETRARVLLAEGRVVEAEKTVRAAVSTLEKGDQLSWLAEALTTHGVALARLNHPDRAREALERAIEIGEQAGDFENAGVAALTIIEQLGRNLSTKEICESIDHARTLLEKTQDIGTLRRLAKAAFESLFLAQALPAPPDWSDFSLREAVRRYEGHLIKLALKRTSGKVTQAAHLLGLKHHQSLASILDSRHKDLLKTRSPVRKRKRHLLVHPKRKKAAHDLNKATQPQISILHVEDNKAVANMVKETLEVEGWNVETCADGNLALEKIASDAHYDLLILDNDLPGMNGLKLVQRARSIAHRRQTPIVMLSATVNDATARQAGADAGLRKPEEMGSLVEAVTRILKLKARRPTGQN